MVRKIYKIGDIPKILFITPVAILGFTFLGTLFFGWKLSSFVWYSIGIIGVLLGIIGSINAYVEIDTNKDEVSFSLGGVFREKVNLSDIESFDTEVKTDVDNNGKVSRKFILSIYGPFGNKSLEFSAQSDLKTVVHALQAAARNR